LEGVEELIDDKGEIKVDKVPVDNHLVAAIEAFHHTLHKRHAMLKIHPISEEDASRRQATQKNGLATCNLAIETVLLAACAPCLALPHMQESDDMKKKTCLTSTAIW